MTRRIREARALQTKREQAQAEQKRYREAIDASQVSGAELDEDEAVPLKLQSRVCHDVNLFNKIFQEAGENISSLRGVISALEEYRTAAGETAASAYREQVPFTIDGYFGIINAHLQTLHGADGGLPSALLDSALQWIKYARDDTLFSGITRVIRTIASCGWRWTRSIGCLSNYSAAFRSRETRSATSCLALLANVIELSGTVAPQMESPVAPRRRTDEELLEKRMELLDRVSAAKRLLGEPMARVAKV